MKSILAALALAVMSTAASADPFDAIFGDSSSPVPVRNVCSNEFKTVEQFDACWRATGSSSQQFGSEGGGDGSSSE